ncbi:hypothetical protein V8F33_006911 [Rhypophila sp. PSN 637]
MGWHLPLHPVEQSLQPPDYFLYVLDVLILSLAGNWTAAYIMYIKKGFKDKSYGMPLAALCVNLGWEFVYGFIYPQGPGEIPWFICDCVLVWMSVKYGRDEWRKSGNSPLIVDNLGVLMVFGCVWASVMNWALIVTCPTVDIASFYSGFITQLFLGSYSVFHLVLRDNTKGHSLPIWACRWAGSSSAMLIFWWRYFHYPESWPLVETPLILFVWFSFQLADISYPFVYKNVRRRELAREAAAALEGKKQ